MDHLVQDLNVALKESESCESTSKLIIIKQRRNYFRRRTRSTGNLDLCSDKDLDSASDESSSGIEFIYSPTVKESNVPNNNEKKLITNTGEKSKGNESTSSTIITSNTTSISHIDSNKSSVINHSDSDDMSTFNRLTSVRALFNERERDRDVRKPIAYRRESLQRHNARSSIRRKRKLKRMCIDEVPVPLSNGKRKRPQRGGVEPMIASCSTNTASTTNKQIHSKTKTYPKIKPLNQTLVERIEKIGVDSAAATAVSSSDSITQRSTSPMDASELNNDFVSDTSLSWSGEEGHEGDDELTDWAPQSDPLPIHHHHHHQIGGGGGISVDQLWTLDPPNSDSREIRAGCRRLYNERPGFSITSGANECIARFMQDAGRHELCLHEGERDALVQLAGLYSLDWWEEGSNIVLRKTGRTPCMQPPQRHYSGLSTAHKRIRTLETTRPL